MRKLWVYVAAVNLIVLNLIAIAAMGGDASITAPVTQIDNLLVTNYAQLTSSSGPTVKTTTTSPNGVATEPRGSLMLRTDAANANIYQNTNASTAWATIFNNTNFPTASCSAGQAVTSVAATGQATCGSVLSGPGSSTIPFGTGSDGACAFNGVTTPVCGATLSGSTYTYQRDVFAASVMVSATVSVNVNGFRTYSTGTCTHNGVTFGRPGPAGTAGGASGTAAGGTGLSANITGGSGGGGTGGDASGGANTAGSASGAVTLGCTSGASSAGGNGNTCQGGGGGANGSGAASLGGANTLYTAANGSSVDNWLLANSVLGTKFSGGSGGGGGRGCSALTGGCGGGGGGGAGGGVAIINCYEFAIGSGVWSAKGGNGGDAGAGTGATRDAGGGGGGGGGTCVLTYAAGTPPTCDVAGGTGGAHGPTGGNNGGNGGLGIARVFRANS